MGGERNTTPGPRAAPPREREPLADEQARKAEEREALADARERKAEEREALADERERKADQREALADERDHQADQREALADERQRLLDERARAVTAEVKQLQEQSRVLIERSQALLAGNGQILQFSGAEATPVSGHYRPRQAGTGTAAKSDPDAAPPFGPGTPIERAIVLREQLSVTLGALAATEEEVARVHDAMAGEGARNADHYRHAAAEARNRAAELRDLQRRSRP